MGGDHHSLVVGGDYSIDRCGLAQGGYRLGCGLRIGAVDVEVAVAHVEGGRLFGRHDEVDPEGLGRFQEIGGAICA